MKKIFLLFVFLSGCDVKQYNESNYVARFLYEADIRGVKIDRAKVPSIDYDDLLNYYTTNAVLGICKQGPKIIVLNTRTWDTMSPTKKEIVIFHELAHCLLGIREHSNRSISLLSAVIPNESDYLKHRTEVLDNLFYKGN